MTPGTSPSPKVELVLTVEGKEYRREMAGHDQVLVKYGKTAESVNGRLSLLTAGVGRLFGAFSAAAAAGYIVKTSKEFEGLNAQLLTVEKSEPRARIAFQRIQEFASATPFQLQEVVEAFIKLRNMGLDPSEEALTAYGNTASSMGKSLNQMIEAVADAAVGEFERLKDFGIKAKSEGDNVTFTFKGMSTTVKKSSEEIQEYLIKLGATEFAGGMKRQAETLDGVLSSFGDSVSALAVKIDSDTGLTGSLKELLKWSTEAINELAGISRPLVQIEADIAALQARISRLPTSGRPSAARVTAMGDLKDLQDELLLAQTRSTKPAQLEAARKELESRLATARTALDAAVARGSDKAPIMRQGKAVLSEGFDELKAVRDLEGQLRELEVRSKAVAQANAEAAAEAEQVRKAAAASAATSDKDLKAQQRVAEQIERNLRDRELEVKLHGDASEAAKVRAEIELGFYKDWKPEQIERLRQLAAEKDAITDLTRAAEKEEEARKKLRAGTDDLVQQLGPKQTGKRFKRDLANARIGEVDDIESDSLGREQRRFEKQLEDLKTHREDILAAGQDYNAMELEAWAQHEDEKTRISREAEETRRGLLQEGLGIAEGIFGDLSAVAQAFGKDGFKAYKAFAIAQATISTIQGAIDAFMRAQQVYPPPAGQIIGGIAAAAVTASGFAQVAQIKAMQYQGGREWGGNVGRGGFVRIGERNRPELYEEDGKFFLLPGERGGKVSPAKEASRRPDRAPNVQINNMGAPVNVRDSMWDGETLQLVIESAVAASQQRTASDINSGRGPVGAAIGSKFGVQPKARR